MYDLSDSSCSGISLDPVIRQLERKTMAFNAKNLHYEKQEPEFLRKLRGEHGGDRHNVQFARPQKDRLRTGDDEDGPTIVDESGEVVGQEEYDAMVEGKAARLEGADLAREKVIENAQDIEDENLKNHPEKQKVAEIGGPRKRKAVKIVGNDGEVTDVVKAATNPKASEAPKDSKAKAGKPKAVRKVKKVKLSFDEPEE